MRLDDLYRRVIMDHYKNPRNMGELEGEAVTVHLNNPSCGDKIQLQLQVEDGKVRAARFQGEGCSISLASASMMTSAVTGKEVEEALDMADQFSSMMQGEDAEFDYEDLEALSGVSKFPARIRCATLAWNALKQGVMESKYR